jgi:hypothetical protein
VSFLCRVAPLALLLILLGAAPAAAASRGVCTIDDPRVIGVSGLIATRSGFIAISDSNFDKSKIRIWYLSPSCRALSSIGYPTPAYDPEDAAIGRDGTLYVADIGDNGLHRSTIAIWSLRPGHRIPTITRYAYPDGPHDAEALLLAADDTPIIVTKDPIRAGVYVPAGPGRLEKVGTFTLTPTATPTGVGPLGGFVITGGANSADRTRVALRSYNDAYEWAVPDGDVVKAITMTTPLITPLPNEPQGESIAYTPDGTGFYTVSDQEVAPIRTVIRRYASALDTVPSPVPSSPSGRPVPRSGAAAPAVRTAGGAAHGPGVPLAVGGLVLVAGCVWIVVRRRSRSRHP